MIELARNYVDLDVFTLLSFERPAQPAFLMRDRPRAP